ncbi:MAG: hypothetical protein BVN32_01460 [Proteobacteria bacterium ST_bin14]|nr:MAG: hypothetical protein BVN32_01460 [Proteobacteria bacterium ST_bin14]
MVGCAADFVPKMAVFWRKIRRSRRIIQVFGRFWSRMHHQWRDLAHATDAPRTKLTDDHGR